MKLQCHLIIMLQKFVALTLKWSLWNDHWVRNHWGLLLGIVDFLYLSTRFVQSIYCFMWSESNEIPEAYSEPCQTPKWRLAKTVNGFQSCFTGVWMRFCVLCNSMILLNGDLQNANMQSCYQRIVTFNIYVEEAILKFYHKYKILHQITV